MADASHGGIVVHNRAVQSFILCVLMVSKCKKSLRIVFFVSMISPYGAVVMHLACNEKICVQIRVQAQTAWPSG